MRRLALPLALSLLAHAGLASLVWLCPAAPDGAQPAVVGADGPALRLSLAGPDKPRAANPTRSTEPDWDINVEPPRIVPAAVASAGGPSPILPVSLPGGGAEQGGTSDGAGGGGFSLTPAGSALLPVPKRARSVVFLLDRSVSMAVGGALGRAIAELKLSLRALPAETSFQVLAYNRFVTPLVPAPAGLAAAEPALVALAAGALDDLLPSGATDHVAALRRGLALRPDLLFLLTDADDLTDKDVLAVTNANRGGTAIHVVELAVSGRSNSPLARLATANGGTHRRVRP
jgi:hypothetical protein